MTDKQIWKLAVRKAKKKLKNKKQVKSKRED
jgi:hypothetical protein